jgi:hypothetical protein
MAVFFGNEIHRLEEACIVRQAGADDVPDEAGYAGEEPLVKSGYAVVGTRPDDSGEVLSITLWNSSFATWYVIAARRWWNLCSSSRACK